jgi:hypothetical protein
VGIFFAFVLYPLFLLTLQTIILTKDSGVEMIKCFNSYSSSIVGPTYWTTSMCAARTFKAYVATSTEFRPPSHND